MTANLRALIADDSYAMSFQSMGQYRTALLSEFDAARRAPPALGEDGLPALADPTVLGSDGNIIFKGYTAEQVRQAQRDAYDAGQQSQAARIQHLTHERDLALAAARQDQQPAQRASVDTDEFEQLLYNFAHEVQGAERFGDDGSVGAAKQAVINFVHAWGSAGSTAGAGEAENEIGHG